MQETSAIPRLSLEQARTLLNYDNQTFGWYKGGETIFQERDGSGQPLPQPEKARGGHPFIMFTGHQLADALGKKDWHELAMPLTNGIGSYIPEDSGHAELDKHYFLNWESLKHAEEAALAHQAMLQITAASLLRKARRQGDEAIVTLEPVGINGSSADTEFRNYLQQTLRIPADNMRTLLAAAGHATFTPFYDGKIAEDGTRIGSLEIPFQRSTLEKIAGPMAETGMAARVASTRRDFGH